MKLFRGIRAKFLLVTTAVFLVFTALLLVIWYDSLSREAERTAVRNMSSLVQGANNVFESQIKDICNIMALTTMRADNHLPANVLNILSEPNLTPAELVSYRKTAEDYLISLCGFKQYINGMMVSDFQGNDVSYGISPSFNEVKSFGWYPELSQYENAFYFMEPHIFRHDSVFSIVRPVYGTGGEMIGFVCANVKSRLFEDVFGANMENPAMLYVMDSQSGKIMYTSGNDKLGIGEIQNPEETFAKHLTADGGTFFCEMNDLPVLVVYHRSTVTNWVTLSVVPRTGIVSGFNAVRNSVFLITGICIAVMLFCLVVFTSLLTRNIVRLTKSVRDIRSEELVLHAAIETSDEVGELYRQFQSFLARIRELIRHIKLTEAKKRRADLLALQAQINPHFLYNTLNTIKFMAALQGADNIGEVSEKLSSLMKITMSDRVFLSVTEEVEYLQSYLSIQRCRYVQAYRTQIDVEEGAEELHLPKLLVQPLVENAFKHGIASRETDGIIVVRFFSLDGILHIRVEDNGPGMEGELIRAVIEGKRNEDDGSIGIYNVAERVRMYFGEPYGLTITSQPGMFTRVDLTLPAIQGEEDSDEEERAAR